MDRPDDTFAVRPVIRRAATGGPARSPDVVWDEALVSRERRWTALGRRGATVWFTGLPASGKSTLAAAVERRLIDAGIAAYRLDGDNLRHGLNGDLGFDAPARAENVRRTAHVARLFADAGVIALVSLVSPYRSDRSQARELHRADGLQFIEVFMDTPLLECQRRDPKALYARAQAGVLRGLTGMDDPYERPETPELEIRPQHGCPDDAAAVVIGALFPLRGVSPRPFR